MVRYRYRQARGVGWYEPFAASPLIELKLRIRRKRVYRLLHDTQRTNRIQFYVSGYLETSEVRPMTQMSGLKIFG